MKDLSMVELANKISNLLLNTLKKEYRRIELPDDTKIRIIGVQDGELILGVPCKVFKLSPPEPLETPRIEPDEPKKEE